jgi:hypothetical protein
MCPPHARVSLGHRRPATEGQSSAPDATDLTSDTGRSARESVFAAPPSPQRVMSASRPRKRPASRPGGADYAAPTLWRGHPPREHPPPMNLRTSGVVGHGRLRPRKRRGVPMRTPALLTCAPAKRSKLLRVNVLRVSIPSGRGRTGRSDGAGSDPAVRRSCTGSGPCAFAHPRPRPLGSLPAQRSLRGKAGFGAASRRPIARSPSILTVGAEHGIRRDSRRVSSSDGVAARTSSSTSRRLPAARWCSSRWAGAFPRSAVTV